MEKLAASSDWVGYYWGPPVGHGVPDGHREAVRGAANRLRELASVAQSPEPEQRAEPAGFGDEAALETAPPPAPEPEPEPEPQKAAGTSISKAVGTGGACCSAPRVCAPGVESP